MRISIGRALRFPGRAGDVDLESGLSECLRFDPTEMGASGVMLTAESEKGAPSEAASAPVMSGNLTTASGEMKLKG